MEALIAEAQAAADAVWALVPEGDVPDAALTGYLVAAYVAATRVFLTEMCPACAHRAAYTVASGDVVVSPGNPLARLN